jgi:hypothetical protein
MGVWRAEPVHDGASHAADAIGTGVQGSKDPSMEQRAPRIAAFQNFDPAMGMLG